MILRFSQLASFTRWMRTAHGRVLGAHGRVLGAHGRDLGAHGRVVGAHGCRPWRTWSRRWRLYIEPRASLNDGPQNCTT